MQTNSQKVAVLDHGFVALRNLSGPTRRVDQMFDAADVDPANSARMSFNQTDSGRTEEQDMKLANYLMKHWHTTPFEMVEVWLEMKMPIFVARQFVRHRTATINEVSGRYVTLPAEWYVPKIVGGKAANKKQGQEDNLSSRLQHEFRAALNESSQLGYDLYMLAINEGIAPEHARLFLGLNHYTHWLWKQDLHNIMNFLRLRSGSGAQVEAQQYAAAIEQLLRQQLPRTMELYDRYRKEL